MKKKQTCGIILPIIRHIAYCIFISATLFSCSNSKYSDYQKTDTELMYKFYTRSKDTIHPKYGEFVTIKMTKRLDDSVLESSSVINPDGIVQYLQKSLFKGSVEEGIGMMSLGDSATFVVKTDSINKYYPAPDSSKNFKKNSLLAYDIKLMNIQTKEDMNWVRDQNRKVYLKTREEQGPKELSQYIQDNHIEIAPNNAGLYYIEIQKGTGAFPKNGDSVVIHYTGSFLNGDVFGSSVTKNTPVGFIVGDTSGRGVIEGWYEGVKKMRKGGKATLLIPPSLAFDSTGMRNPKTGKYLIPPYTSLKFDLQLLDINPKK